MIPTPPPCHPSDVNITADLFSIPSQLTRFLVEFLSGEPTTMSPSQSLHALWSSHLANTPYTSTKPFMWEARVQRWAEVMDFPDFWIQAKYGA